MKQHEGLLADAGKLRRHAEDLLRKQMSIPGKMKNNGEMFRQLYELQINQIEIDLLNAEFWQLQQTGKAPRAEEAHHADSRKVTRIGYLILNRGGVIREAKLQNSRYKEVLPPSLVGQRIEKSLYADDRPGFAAFLAKVFKSKTKEMCELRLDCPRTQKTPVPGAPVFVKIEAITDAAGLSCLMVVNDNTDSKLAEQQERARNALMETLHKTIAAIRRTAIPQSIIQLAADLKLDIVAEGVETESQKLFLHKNGCDVIQGYLFSKPVSADEFAMAVVAEPHRQAVCS